MKQAEFEAIVNDCIGTIRSFVEAKVGPIATRTATLETRLAALTMMLPSARAKPNGDPDGDKSVQSVIRRLEKCERKLHALENKN